MKSGNILILDLDFEYKLWKNKLLFYSREIELLLDRLEVLKREKPSFYLEDEKSETILSQQKAIQGLKNQIKTMEQEMAFYAEDYPINKSHSHYLIHETIRNEMEKLIFRQDEIISSIYPELCYPLREKENI